MKENKGKDVASGTEGEEDVQVQDDVTPLVVQKPVIQARKRKGISSSVDLGELPTRRGPKKKRFGKIPPPKVPKFPLMKVDLDDSIMNLVPVQTTSSVQLKNLPLPTAKAPHEVVQKTRH